MDEPNNTNPSLQNNNTNNPMNDVNARHDAIKEKQKKYHGKYFVIIILITLSIEYYVFVFHMCLGNINNVPFTFLIVILILFHICVSMMMWAYYTVMKTSPGEIPLYWGFYIGDDDYKRKRYCLISNAYKPERSHHCSVCNTCVLNMDHHCPWVDNCIGFYNRKFFMQLLFYVCLLTIYVDISMAYFAYLIVRDIFRMKLAYNNSIHAALILSGYSLVFGFSIIITRFFNFHINLVLTNSTTIESLDKEHKEENRRFCLSQKENWEQVFGSSVLLWFIPMDLEKGRPVGDGLTWPIREVDEAHNLQNNNIAPNAISNLVQQQEQNNNESNKQNIEMRNMANYNTNFASTSPMSPQGGI